METTRPAIKVCLLSGDFLEAHKVNIKYPGGEALVINLSKPNEESSDGITIAPRKWVSAPSAVAYPLETLELKGHSRNAEIVILNQKSRMATLITSTVEEIIIGRSELVKPHGGLQPVPIDGSDFSWIALGSPSIHYCPMEGNPRRRSRSKDF